MVKILYTSCLCSTRLAANDIIIQSLAIQKFHRLIVKGLNKNGVNISNLSSTPRVNGIKDDFDGINNYHYCYTIEKPILRQITLFFSALFYTVKWIIHTKGNKVIICDVLNISISLGSIVACKLFRCDIVGVVTDIPGMMVGTKKNIISTFIVYIDKFTMNLCDKYVFLTEKMNNLLNYNNKPYIIMEGLVDSDLSNNNTKVETRERIVVYAGGLFEKYGVKTLIDAFSLVEDKTIKLYLYGNGDLVPYINEKSNSDPRIHYLGIVPNSLVVQVEHKALLLVNPRPITEEFTKYSFPSKNMEYMVSGTPLLTTKLPGMPKEYYPYVFFIEDESAIGIKNAIQKVISLPLSEIEEFGTKAKDFVLHNKNDIIQTKKIIGLMFN